MAQRNYWAVRTARENQGFFFNELQAGRLRQGWGYDSRLDARKLVEKYNKQGWDALDEEERDAWRNLKLAGFDNNGDKGGGVKVGDIILIPNLPEDSMFCFVEVVGEYDFHIPNEIKDFGHILPVKLLTPNGVHNLNQCVHADIRYTLRTRNRMWSLDYYKNYLDEILGKASAGEALDKATDPKEQLTEAIKKASNPIRVALWEEVQRVLQAAEWEQPLRKALAVIYPGAGVEHHGGPNEKGKDLLIQWPNPFDEHGKRFVIPVQVKNYSGTHDDTGALEQIDQAVRELKGNSHVIAAVILSTADKFSENFQKERQRIEEMLGIPLIAALRPQVMDILLAAQIMIRFPAAPE